MASRPFSQSFRGDRSALDLPVAALAGIAVAFAAFAVPSDVLAELIGATRLPEILPAAQPPLGTTARIALASGGALAVFVLAFLLLRWLDRFAAAPAKPATVAPLRPASIEAPKLRKRDSHPDAPAVRPISAIREFGEPASPIAVKRRPTIEPEPEPARESEVARHEPAEPIAVERMPMLEPEPGPARLSSVARPEPAEPDKSAEPLRPPSLSELMARLEKGLAERRTEPAAAEADVPAARPAPQVFPEAGDDRLQSAIENLQRLAARDR